MPAVALPAIAAAAFLLMSALPSVAGPLAGLAALNSLPPLGCDGAQAGWRWECHPAGPAPATAWGMHVQALAVDPMLRGGSGGTGSNPPGSEPPGAARQPDPLPFGGIAGKIGMPFGAAAEHASDDGQSGDSLCSTPGCIILELISAPPERRGGLLLAGLAPLLLGCLALLGAIAIRPRA